MKVIIQEEIINKSELRDWSFDIGVEHEKEWIRQIAEVIIEWFGENLFMEVMTSGSTGIPKRIQHSKESMIVSAQLTGQRFGLLEGMTSLNCLPAQYIAGKMMLIRALVLELDQICIEPKLVLTHTSENEIDFSAMTPMQLSSTLETNPSLVDQIRKLILGGGPLTKNLSDDIVNLKTQCFATYGMTESITHIATRPTNGSKRTEIFEAVESVHFEVENNNLIIFAPHIADSPLHTTDCVQLIDKNHFRWLGRSDNVINSGGVKIHPEQIEEKLQSKIHHRYIITGAPDDKSGEQVVLIIESLPYDGTMKEALLNALESLPKIERPKNIFFLQRLLETPTGKIKRNYKLYIPKLNLS